MYYGVLHKNTHTNINYITWQMQGNSDICLCFQIRFACAFYTQRECRMEWIEAKLMRVRAGERIALSTPRMCMRWPTLDSPGPPSPPPRKLIWRNKCVVVCFVWAAAKRSSRCILAVRKRSVVIFGWRWGEYMQWIFFGYCYCVYGGKPYIVHKILD